MRQGNLFSKIICTIIFIALSGCATVGPTVSSQEVEAKRLELKGKAAVYQALQQKRLDAITNRLVSYMLPEEREKLQNVKVVIKESSDINAHATWGEVSVTYGMLRFTDSDDEMAVVIAHELSHLLQSHVSKSLATNVLSTALGVAASTAVDTLTQGSGVGGTVGNVVSQGVSGTFSRGFEREADYHAFRYVYIAGFDLMKGSQIWERLAIEAPQTMTANFLASHPSSPERLVRAEKTLAELVASGIQPNIFHPATSAPAPSSISSGILQTAVAVPMKALSVSGAVIGKTVGTSLAAMPSLSKESGDSGTASATEKNQEAEKQLSAAEKTLEQKEKELGEKKRKLTEEEALLQARQGELSELLKEQEKRLEQVRNEAQKQAQEDAEFQRILLEAKEAAKQMRYDEFGIERIGIAKKVANLWVGESITGEQNMYPVSQGSVDWYVKYRQWSSNSWKALAMFHRHYSAYWYMPDGRLFKDEEFKQSTVRSEFARTTLEWDPSLGDRLIGVWTLRIFEDGKLLDERTFELVK